MNMSIIILIAGMGIATYVPRMLPFILFRGKTIPAFWQRVLANIPYATLGALIFPGILYIRDDIWYGLVSGASGVALGILGFNIIFVVLGSVGVLMICLSFT